MSDTSDTLRRAAKVLREHAEPLLVDGRWEPDRNGPRDEGYIALVDPPVGLALADWLEIVAAWPDEGLGNIPGLDRTNWPDAWQDVSDHALTLARAILREAPDA